MNKACSIRKKFVLGSFVNCGQHRANTCFDCTNGYDGLKYNRYEWCNGECEWDGYEMACKRRGIFMFVVIFHWESTEILFFTKEWEIAYFRFNVCRNWLQNLSFLWILSSITWSNLCMLRWRKLRKSSYGSGSSFFWTVFLEFDRTFKKTKWIL